MKIEEIFLQITNDIKNEFQLKGKLLKNLPLEIKAFVVAISYIFHTLIKRVISIEGSVFVHLVKSQAMLRLHMDEYDMKPKEGTPAVGKIEIEATSVVSVAEGTYFVYLIGEETYDYITTEAKTLAPNTKTEIGIKSVSNGDKYNLDEGEILYMKSPIVGLVDEARVVSLADGTNEEGFVDQKKRMLARKKATGTGGTVDNYMLWASDVSGVLRSKVFSGDPSYGRIKVLFVLNSISNFIPSAAKIEEVRVALQEKTAAGITVFVEAPAQKVLDIRISNLVFDSSIVSDLATITTNIRNAIREYLLSRALDSNPITFSQISEVIGGVAGETSHALTINNAVVDISIGEKEVGVLGVFEVTQ